jgi:dihydrofolate reductase
VRKLVVAEYVSLDGVIQAPGHAGEDDAGGFLLGRLTYEIFAASWPKVTDEHDQIARALNTLPKHVASKSLPQADWQGTTVLDGGPQDSFRLADSTTTSGGLVLLTYDRT